jgi:hypothetical protein
LFAGGLFHFNKDSKTYNLKSDGLPMYAASDDDPLINDVGIYILDKLGTFQNMSAVYKVTAETDLHDYVGSSTILVDNTRIYRFSKELLAYLEMCVAFCPYYRQDDPRTAGAMNTYYRDALQAYAAVPYKDLHAYLERRMGAWYFKFKPASSEVVEVEDAELGDVVPVPGVDGEGQPFKKGRYSLNYVAPAEATPPTPPAAAGSTSGDSEESPGEASGGRTATASPLLDMATLSKNGKE